MAAAAPATLASTRPVRLIEALLVSTFWARIYLGDHWLSDAIGGLALGIASGCVALAWLRGRRVAAHL